MRLADSATHIAICSSPSFYRVSLLVILELQSSSRLMAYRVYQTLQTPRVIVGSAPEQVRTKISMGELWEAG